MIIATAFERCLERCTDWDPEDEGDGEVDEVRETSVDEFHSLESSDGHNEAKEERPYCEKQETKATLSAER